MKLEEEILSFKDKFKIERNVYNSGLFKILTKEYFIWGKNSISFDRVYYSFD